MQPLYKVTPCAHSRAAAPRGAGGHAPGACCKGRFRTPPKTRAATPWRFAKEPVAGPVTVGYPVTVGPVTDDRSRSVEPWWQESSRNAIPSPRYPLASSRYPLASLSPRLAILYPRYPLASLSSTLALEARVPVGPIKRSVEPRSRSEAPRSRSEAPRALRRRTGRHPPGGAGILRPEDFKSKRY